MNNSVPTFPGAALHEFSVSRETHEPAYVQVASHLRRMIAAGTYPPGSQLPPEAALSRAYGISGMTVRQAIGLLTDEGLVQRIQGRGTFVKTIKWQGSGFSLKYLEDLIGDQNNTKVKILAARIIRADERLASRLAVLPGCRLINIVRLLLRNGQAVLLQNGFFIYDPGLPVLEAELDVISLSGLFTGAPNRLIKKGELEALPIVLEENEARQLEKPVGAPALALEYLFWDLADKPVGSGFFLVPQSNVSLKARIGLWL